MAYLLEYNEQEKSFNRNYINNGQYNHRPNTNGYKSICLIEDEELSADENFNDLKEALRAGGTAFKTVKAIINLWVSNWKNLKK